MVPNDGSWLWVAPCPLGTQERGPNCRGQPLVELENKPLLKTTETTILMQDLMVKLSYHGGLLELPLVHLAS